MKNIMMNGGLITSMVMAAAVEAGAGDAKAADTAAAAEVGPPVGAKNRRLTDEQIKEIRALRALRHPDGHDKAGSPVWTHKALADKFGTQAGVISQIVRNRSHKDPDYKPVNDGK